MTGAVTTRAAAPMELVARYGDERAPRYTSYPTAVQFSEAVDAATYADWLGALPVNEAVSLYVHVPMCARLCWYCGCNTRAVNRPQPITDYVEWLVDELSLLEQALPGRLPASAVHLGGGTPNMLSRDNLARLFGALRRVFRLEAGAEVAAELDPAVLTRDWVWAARGQGLSRASLGVQDLSPAVQAAVNRPEPFAVIVQAVRWLREVDVGSINLDLMYGLPRQSTADVLATLEAVLTLRPDRIALFGYAHVPWMKPHQKLIDEALLPGPAERLEQSEAAAGRLTAEGYVRIGLDHFARAEDELAVAHAQGRLHRNFQGYTTDAAATLIGVGASSVGRLPQGYVQNASQERAWREAVGAGALPVARGVALSDDDRFRGEIIERLMCDLRVDLAAVCGRHGRTLADLAPELAALQRFVADGLASLDGGDLAITPRGRILVRSVCAVFDAWLRPEAGRHARAI